MECLGTAVRQLGVEMRFAKMSNATYIYMHYSRRSLVCLGRRGHITFSGFLPRPISRSGVRGTAKVGFAVEKLLGFLSFRSNMSNRSSILVSAPPQSLLVLASFS